MVTLPLPPSHPFFLQGEKNQFEAQNQFEALKTHFEPENGHVRSFLKLETVISNLQRVTFAHMPFPRLPQHLKHPASGIDASSGFGGICEAQTI